MNPLALLKNRWLLGSIGFLAFSLIAWSMGELVAFGDARPFESPAGRAALIAVVAALWIGGELWRARRSRQENERLLEVLGSGDGEATDSAARAAREVQVLRQRFEEAAAFLKKARFKGPDGEGRYVHELPWYVFIGAPGSGKTTALVNSGLRFPLREGGGPGGDLALAGVGGTRNCDWWFTDEAVLLDTAGRYTTQESDLEADAAAWQGFLGLIRRFRPRRPLNGALVTLSVSDLMLWNEEERRRYAWHVRARVAELYDRLGVRFPVYLLVTKADLMAGFMEFFGELDADARKRVWGVTFSGREGEPADRSPGQRFADELVELERRLHAEMLTRLHDERDLQRRAAAYRFPQEFHGIGPLVEQFLDSAFRGVQGAPEPMLRGVYFTSGTQEGNPIDRVLGTLSRSFRLERTGGPTPAVAAGTGKSFFLTRLVREVIFAESGLAGANKDVESRERRARALSYAAIGAASIALAALWTVSYSRNRAFVETAQQQAVAARAELEKLGALHPGGEPQLVRALNALRDLPGGYAQQGAGLLGLGLSQQEKLGAQALRAYRNALRDALGPRLAASKGDYSKWRLSEAERADLAGHVRAIADEAIITNTRQKQAPSKAS